MTSALDFGAVVAQRNVPTKACSRKEFWLRSRAGEAMLDAGGLLRGGDGSQRAPPM